jgi:hypothetical protein
MCRASTGRSPRYSARLGVWTYFCSGGSNVRHQNWWMPSPIQQQVTCRRGFAAVWCWLALQPTGSYCLAVPGLFHGSMLTAARPQLPLHLHTIPMPAPFNSLGPARAPVIGLRLDSP